MVFDCIMEFLIMKIAFLATGDVQYDTFPNGGGIENQIWGISNELVKKGHEVHILTRNRGFVYGEIDGINIHEINTIFGDQVLTRFIFSKNAAKKIEEIKPDVLNLSERFSAYFPSQLNIPKTFITHNSDAFSLYRKSAYHSNKLNYFFFDIKRKCEEDVMHRSDSVISLNKSIEKYLHSRGINHTEIIPNGINVNLYKNEIDDDFILYAGRLNKLKGVDNLIKAYSEIQKSHRLVIIGSGPDEIRLKQLVKANRLSDWVDFIPWVNPDKLREYISKCSIFVLPSLFETFGVVVLEAMACGKTVIASDIMGPRDIITNGKNGFLFEKGNSLDLKECLEKCIEDKNLMKKIGSSAKLDVENNYSFENVSNKYVRHFNALVEHRI